MSIWDWVRALAIIGPIVAMVVVGMIVAARSGVAQLAAAGGGRRVVENVSRAAVVLAGCLLGLAMLHQLVGQHLPRMW